MPSLISFNPFHWNLMAAQRNATGSDTAPSLAGSSAASTVQAQNGLKGSLVTIPLYTAEQVKTKNFTTDRAKDDTSGGTDAVPLAKNGLVQITGGDADTGINYDSYLQQPLLVNAWAAALKNMEKQNDFARMWGQARVNPPSYVLGR